MTEDDALRLHKFLAQAGIASRRAAEQLIQQGRVRVNGVVVETLGTKIDPETDEVSVDGQAVQQAEARTTVLLSKPAGVITSMHDPEGRRTVATLLAAEPYRLVPVGRLDFHTEGVLLLTTDGELAHRLLHPSHKVPKIYVVRVGGHPTPAALDQLRNGVQLEDGMTLPALVDHLQEEDRSAWLEIIITEGRQRQVRRMCEAVGHRPMRVVRTAFATLDAEGLEPGQYRYLSRSELSGLYKLVGLEVPPMSERARELGTGPQGEGERGRGPLPGDERVGRPRARPADRGGARGGAGERGRGPAGASARGRAGEGEREAPRGRPGAEGAQRGRAGFEDAPRGRPGAGGEAPRALAPGRDAAPGGWAGGGRGRGDGRAPDGGAAEGRRGKGFDRAADEPAEARNPWARAATEEGAAATPARGGWTGRDREAWSAPRAGTRPEVASVARPEATPPPSDEGESFTYGGDDSFAPPVSEADQARHVLSPAFDEAAAPPVVRPRTGRPRFGKDEGDRTPAPWAARTAAADQASSAQRIPGRGPARPAKVASAADAHVPLHAPGEGGEEGRGRGAREGAGRGPRAPREGAGRGAREGAGRGARAPREAAERGAGGRLAGAERGAGGRFAGAERGASTERGASAERGAGGRFAGAERGASTERGAGRGRGEAAGARGEDRRDARASGRRESARADAESGADERRSPVAGERRGPAAGGWRAAASAGAGDGARSRPAGDGAGRKASGRGGARAAVPEPTEGPEARGGRGFVPPRPPREDEASSKTRGRPSASARRAQSEEGGTSRGAAGDRRPRAGGEGGRSAERGDRSEGRAERADGGRLPGRGDRTESGESRGRAPARAEGGESRGRGRPDAGGGRTGASEGGRSGARGGGSRGERGGGRFGAPSEGISRFGTTEGSGPRAPRSGVRGAFRGGPQRGGRAGPRGAGRSPRR